MNSFGMFGGLFGQPRLFNQQQQWGYQQWTDEQMKFARQLGMEAGRNIANRYYEGMQNNRQVTCAYCRTPRMSMQKECKGCGASEVMA